MVDAICKEIILQKDYLPTKNLETIYFGGGTPSLLSESELVQIFEAIHSVYNVAANAEITLEANPDDLTEAKLKELRKYVNRLSIGIQSFDDASLKFMNRAHGSEEASNCVRLSQDAGFENISIDLMYNSIPSNENIQLWKGDLEKAILLDVPHISAYSLTIEPKTALEKWVKTGKIKPTDEDISAEQFEIMAETLIKSGYEHYEVSSFAKPNQYSKHNSSYWKRKPYLGVGPSAHSYNGSSRQFNVSNNSKYITAISQNIIPAEIEILSKNDQANDYLLTSLRTMWGSEIEVLNKIIGQNFCEIQKNSIDSFLKQKLLEIKNNTLLLTSKGKLFADYIASELFL